MKYDPNGSPGAPELQRRERPQSPRKNATKYILSLPIKKILTIAVPIIVLVIIAIIVVPMIGKSSSSGISNNIYFIDDSGETLVSGNNNAKFSITGTMDSSQASLDGSKAIVLTALRNTGGALWFVTPSGATHIADGVYSYLISDTGNGVAYYTDYDVRNSMATLHLYDTTNKKSRIITESAMFFGDDMSGVTLSPNGKSIGYIGNFTGIVQDFTGYISIDGKEPEELGSATFAVAISDGGKYIYYIKMLENTRNGSLHVRSSRNEYRLISATDSISILLNKDYSEVVFNVYSEDSRTFISKNGGERDRIAGASIQSLITPRGTQIKSYFNSGVSLTIYGIRSFSGFMAITDEGLSYYDGKLVAKPISNSSYYPGTATISSDGKTLHFINNTKRLTTLDPTAANPERRDIDKDIKSFIASDDGKTVYYVNEYNELYFAGSSGAPVKIADEVSATSLALSFSSNRLFFLMDYMPSRGGELYYSTNGAKRAKVSGADEIMSVWSTPTNVYFITRDRELYRSNGNEKFTRIHDDM